MNFRIASVHWYKIHCERSLFTPKGIYVCEGVAPGDPAKFVTALIHKGGELVHEQGINDRIQFDYGGHEDSNSMSQRRQVKDTIFANEIAYDLVNNWTKNIPGGSPTCHPGVWVVRERVADTVDGKPVIGADNRQVWREATKPEALAMWEEDIAHNRAADSQYARKVFDYWDAAISKYPKMIDALPEMVRAAALCYGWQVDWLRSTAAIETRPCPFCDRFIRKAAIICPHQDCQQVVDYDRFAIEMKKKQDAFRRVGVDPTKIDPALLDPGQAIMAGVSGKGGKVA